MSSTANDSPVIATVIVDVATLQQVPPEPAQVSY